MTITKTCLKMRARETATENVRSLMFYRLRKNPNNIRGGWQPPPLPTHPALYMYVRGLRSGLVFDVNIAPTVKAHSQHVLQI